MAKKPTPKVSTQAEPGITGIETAPEIHIDGFQGVMVRNNGIVKISFFTDIFNPLDETITRKCAFIMDTDFLVITQIRNSLNGIIQEVEEKNLVVKDVGEQSNA